MYKIGDKVVHLSHGVGVISNIEEREFKPGEVKKFYILTIQDNGAPKKVFVPFESIERLRSVIPSNEVGKVYDALETKYPIDHQTWNRRYRHYMELIHTGDVLKIAEVVVSLNSLMKEKDLSFGERKLFDQSLRLLTEELSLAENLNKDQIQTKLMLILGE